MYITIIINDIILDLDENINFAITDNRASFLNPLKRQYTIVKGLKLKKTAKNSQALGYAYNNYIDLSTVRAVSNVIVNISGLYEIEGTLRVTGNNEEYFLTVFTSKNSNVDAFEALTLESVIDAHVFDTATWNALPTFQARQQYLANNTDPAWLMPLVGGEFHPYDYSRVDDIIPYGNPGTYCQQDLYYNIGEMIKESIALSGINIYVIESGLEVAFASSNIYTNVISLLFTPTFVYSSDTASAWPLFNPPVKNNGRYIFEDVFGLSPRAGETAQYKQILTADITYIKQTIWDMLVVLSKYLGFVIDVSNTGKILFVPFSEIGTTTPIDLSELFIKEVSKTYYLSGYEKESYLRFRTQGKVPDTAGEASFTQNISWLKEETVIGNFENIFPNVLELNSVDYFQVVWSTELSDKFIFLKKSTTLQSTMLERDKGSATVIVFNSVNLHKMEFYSPSSEYSILQTALDDPIIFEAEFNFDLYNYSLLNIHTPVLVRQLGGVFVIEPFDFVLGKPTKLKLIKIA